EHDDTLHVLRLDAFQLLAWGTAFYLLAGRGSPHQPRWRELIAAASVCLIGILAPPAVSLVALTLFLLATAVGDGRQLAAATVVAALFAQQVIAPIAFDLLVDRVTRWDAMLVGAIVKATVAGATVDGNIIAVPSGHAIEILSGCCSLHNISPAILAWVALTKLERPQWRRGDIAVLVAVVACQVLGNALRIYLMAQSDDLYVFWHTGIGSKIYACCASAAAILVSAYGAQMVTRSGAGKRFALPARQNA
ncbi:MAG: exosortase/archaeosortase family protein, partial [Hyphomicrobiales bacterium]|nr:exosortase/archaeosortase family protein [Hyphomicrobiales bacterium]